MNLLISPADLHRMLDSESEVLVVDARAFSEYSHSHIPGAVNIDLTQFHWLDTSSTGIRDFNRQSRKLLSNIGVRKGKFVVFYENNSGMSAARGVWLLLYFSHSNVAMLDGGFSEWKKAKFETEKKANAFRHSSFRGRPDKRILASLNDIKRAIHSNNNSTLLDVRSMAEHAGTVARAARTGHIPGAINIDWLNNLNGDKLKDQLELERLYEGVPRNSTVITYCQGGYRAANTFVALKILGYKNVRMYLGSWGEWGNKPDLPIEK